MCHSTETSQSMQGQEKLSERDMWVCFVDNGVEYTLIHGKLPEFSKDYISLA